MSRYLRQHETELLLHDGAENMLKRFGIDTKNLDVEKLRSDYNSLYSKKQALQKTYKTAEKESADLNRKLDNLNQYLDRTPEQAAVDKKVEKTKIPSKFDIKKGGIPTRFCPPLRYTLMCVAVPVFRPSSYLMLCIFLYRSFMYFDSLSNCILL